MDVHPLGDHLIVGGYDRKLCWFDLELSDKPYKILRYAPFPQFYFHPRFNLFSSLADTTAEQFGLCISTLHIPCLRPHRMMGLSKCSMPGFTTI